MRALAQQAGVRDVRDGCFAAIPVEDSSRDAVVSGYAIRYASDLDAAFREVHRVLRPGGRMVILEMIAPRPGWRRSVLARMIRDVGAPALAVVCGAGAVRELMRHFWDSVSSFDSPDRVSERLREVGFEDVEYRHVGGLLGEFRATRPASDA
jgi:demethylmenaquinone methyltransferase/2-methoxy-6-polyprenyl-1,4-benzoquinol methylase